MGKKMSGTEVAKLALMLGAFVLVLLYIYNSDVVSSVINESGEPGYFVSGPAINEQQAKQDIAAKIDCEFNVVSLKIEEGAYRATVACKR